MGGYNFTPSDVCSSYCTKSSLDWPTNCKSLPSWPSHDILWIIGGFLSHSSIISIVVEIWKTIGRNLLRIGEDLHPNYSTHLGTFCRVVVVPFGSDRDSAENLSQLVETFEMDSQSHTLLLGSSLYQVS